MTYADFASLLAAETKRTVEDLLAEKPLSFAMATNKRGEALVKSIKRWSRVNFVGKRALDAGCAYGGLSIALAKAGASTVGLESSAKLLAYAEANASGAANVQLSLADLSSFAIRQKFSARSFDLIFLNDSLERNYDADALVANVDYLLADDGLVHFKTVNSHSTRFILSDGHKKLFGLPLMDPDLLFLLKLKKTPVYYRPITSYLALFQYYNMPKRVLVDDEQVLTRRTERWLTSQIREIFAKARSDNASDPALASMLRKQTAKLRDRYVFDLQARGADYAKVKYGSGFFSGWIGRPDSDLGLRFPTVELPEFGGIVSLVQSADGGPERAASSSGLQEQFEDVPA